MGVQEYKGSKIASETRAQVTYNQSQTKVRGVFGHGWSIL